MRSVYRIILSSINNKKRIQLYYIRLHLVKDYSKLICSSTLTLNINEKCEFTTTV